MRPNPALHTDAQGASRICAQVSATREAFRVSMRQVVGIIVLAAALGGCAFDRREEVAAATLVNDQGIFDEAAYAGAIRARYPEGTPLKSLLGYVKQARGECNTRENGRLWCEIPTRGGLCWAQLLGLDVGVSQDTVRDIKVHVGGLGC